MSESLVPSSPTTVVRVSENVSSGTDQASNASLRDVPINKYIGHELPNLLLMITGYGFIVLCSLFRGGHGFESIIGIESCSTFGWLILSVCQIGLILLSYLGMVKNRDPFGYHPSGKARVITKGKGKMPSNTKIVFISYLSGVLSGTLGVGGGLVVNPMLMGFGYDPQSTAAVSNLSVFFSATSTSTQFLTVGAIHWEHAWVLMVLSLTGSLVGHLVLTALIKKYKRPSLIIWTILIVLVISVVTLPTEIAFSLTYTWNKIFEFGSSC